MYALQCAKILNELGTEIFLHINELLLQYSFFKIVRLGKSLFWGKNYEEEEEEYFIYPWLSHQAYL